MTTQVDNGDLYIAQYAGHTGIRVEARSRSTYLGHPGEFYDPPLILDVTWAEFKEIIRLGHELIAKCEGPESVQWLDERGDTPHD